MGVKRYTKERFCEIEKGKPIGFLPPVLSIYADLVDIYNAKGDTKDCKAYIMNCPIEKKCVGRRNCSGKIRQVYIYKDEHKLIFDSPVNLPSNIRINSNSLEKEEEEEKEETSNHENNFEIMVGEVILKHYLNIHWLKYCCSMDDYIDILSSLFFFCPDVLWCALNKEIYGKQIDYNVSMAITRCLDLFTLFDKMIRDHKGEMFEYEKEALLTISSKCQIYEIVQIVIGKDITKLNSIDRAGIIARLATDNFQLLCDQMNKELLKEKKMKKILGRMNYRCVVNCCKTMPYVG